MSSESRDDATRRRDTAKMMKELHLDDGANAQVQELQAQLEQITRDFQRVYKLLAGQRHAQLEGVYKMLQYFPLAQYADSDPDRTHKIGELAAAVGHAFGKPVPYCEALRYAAPMCELDQPDLNSEIEAILEMAHEIARNLNENYDGSGFPRQLKKREIPLSARIALVAHGFYTCQADKPFGFAMSEDDSLAMLRKATGGRYDPEVLEALARALILKKIDERPGLRGAAVAPGVD